MKISDNTLYLEDISAELIMQEYGSPLYVYEESVLRSCFRQLISGFPEGLLRIHYSMKANSNQSILKFFARKVLPLMQFQNTRYDLLLNQVLNQGR